MLLLPTLAACSGGAGAPATSGTPAPADLPDVVLITLDTTRADRLGSYGYKDAKTDSLDALAASGMRFANAISPLPLTIPAHATMLTGLQPYHHGIRSNGDNVLDEKYTTLAEHLQTAGYRTAGSVAAFVTTRQWGFSQGFDAFYDSMPEGEGADKNYWHTERIGETVVDDALGWLAGQPEDKPVFLWLHLYDPHFPYIARAPYDEAMKDRPYDAELAYVDDQIGRVVSAFEGRNVLWAIIGDHGEGLGEHQEITHGLFTYQATQHVPWILSGAGVTPGITTSPVSTADLTPTVLKLLGLTVPDGLDGQPQPAAGAPDVPYAESYQLSDRFKLAPHRMVLDGTLKLIDTPRPELYDLASDPGEKANLADSRPDDVARLKKLLTDKQAAPPNGSNSSMDAETQAQLASLGYTSPSMGDIDYAVLPDPKDYREFFEKLNKIERQSSKLSPGENLTLLDEAIALKTDAFELRMRRVNVLARMKRFDEARDYVQTLTTDFGDEARVWATLAGMAVQQNQPEQALEYAREALKRDPHGGTAREIEVQSLFQLKSPEEAVAIATKYTTENPKEFGVSALLGQYWLKKQDFKKAEQYLRVGVSSPTPRRAARSQLALLAIAAGARNDAYNLLEPEVKDFPGNAMARRLLSRLYGEDQRWLDQKPQVEAIARSFPKEAEAHRALAQCHFNLADYTGARKVIDVALGLAADDPDVLLLHANLLAKEGKKDEGYVVFQRATDLNTVRVREAEKKGATVVRIDPTTGKPIDQPTESTPAPKPTP
ncbi:MAG: tetratricopeptide repeat protein [Myxococcales bacterium]|nr:tetratricopeptide repeat protein [Myxococcales bacterium]